MNVFKNPRDNNFYRYEGFLVCLMLSLYILTWFIGICYENIICIILVLPGTGLYFIPNGLLNKFYNRSKEQPFKFNEMEDPDYREAWFELEREFPGSDYERRGA